MADAFDPSVCSGGRQDAFEGSIGLRIGAIFIIGVSSAFTTLFPVVTRRIPKLSVPQYIFDFAKFFGSGVIIATAFIHLLSPGASDEELGSKCLSDAFQNYPFAFAFAMIAAFMTFIVELLSFRVGAGLAQKLAYDPHMDAHHHALQHGAIRRDTLIDGQDDSPVEAPATSESHQKDLERSKSSKDEYESSVSIEQRGLSAAASEILGVMILEFGVIFHSVIIGITLGTTNDFVTLFIVIIFHQAFEGLGLGSRLALLPLKRNSWIPFVGAAAYSIVTPIGIAIGLGIRHTYNADSTTAAYVTGVFDSVSAGILLYTGFVELLAHEFIFNEKMRTAPLGRVLLAVAEMLTGAGLMALLGYWA